MKSYSIYGICLFQNGGFVPRKAQNPLTFGLPAHIYLLCYFSPQKGYSLGKKIYQPEKGIPPTSKIYPWLKQLKGKYLEETKDGCTAILDPLILEIKKKVESRVSLTTKEETQLTNLIESKEFRNYTEGWYNRDRKYEQHGWSEVIIGHKEEGLNALRLISETLGMLATLSVIRLEFSKIPLEEDEKKMEKIYRQQSKDESWVQQQMNGIKQYNAVIKYFKKFSTEFLLKLTVLYPHSEVMLQTEKALYLQKYLGTEHFGWKKIQ